MMNSGLKTAAVLMVLAGTAGVASTAGAQTYCYPASGYTYSSNYSYPYGYSYGYSYPAYSSSYYYPASSYSYGYDSNVVGAGLLGLGLGYAIWH